MPEKDFFQVGTRTTDATPDTLARYALFENSLVDVRVSVLALSPAGVAACWNRNACVKRGTGNAAVVGVAPGSTIKDAGAAAWDINPHIEGDAIVVSVIGTNTDIIDWLVSMIGREVSSAG